MPCTMRTKKRSRGHVGSSHLGSNVVLLVRTTSSIFVIVLPGKTSQHASQGMDGNGHSQWMGPGSPWTSTESRCQFEFDSPPQEATCAPPIQTQL